MGNCLLVTTVKALSVEKLCAKDCFMKKFTSRSRVILIIVMILLSLFIFVAHEKMPVSEEYALRHISEIYEDRLPEGVLSSHGEARCNISGRPSADSYRRNGVWSADCSYWHEHEERFLALVGVDEFGFKVAFQPDNPNEWDIHRRLHRRYLK